MIESYLELEAYFLHYYLLLKYSMFFQILVINAKKNLKENVYVKQTRS